MPRTTGFVERFNAVLDESFRVKMREMLCESVEALRADPDASLASYATERPHLDDHNQGRRPIETISRLVRREG